MNAEGSRGLAGSQTLTRGLDILGVVASGPVRLDDLVNELSLSKPTTHRLVKALVDRGFLSVTRQRYHLGRAVLELGSRARAQIDVARIGRPHVAELSKSTEAVIYLARADGEGAVCIDQTCSSRRSKPLVRIGDAFSLERTAIGQAFGGLAGNSLVVRFEGDQDEIWSVAAPIRDADDHVIAAIAASQFSRDRVGNMSTALAENLQRTADAISADCGRWCREQQRNAGTPHHRRGTDDRTQGAGR